MTSYSLHTALLAGILALLLAACATQEEIPEEPEDIPLKSVEYVDLDRYMGRWYMMANIPYFMEQGNLATFVEYSRREDGLIDDHFEAQDGFDQPRWVKQGLIEILDTETNAEGRVTFLRPIWQDFSVLYVDDDYQYTVIGHPTRNYAWIFAREPHLDEGRYLELRAVLTDNGFDVNRVLRIPHRPEEIGLPGYQ